MEKPLRRNKRAPKSRRLISEAKQKLNLTMMLTKKGGRSWDNTRCWPMIQNRKKSFRCTAKVAKELIPTVSRHAFHKAAAAFIDQPGKYTGAVVMLFYVGGWSPGCYMDCRIIPLDFMWSREPAPIQMSLFISQEEVASSQVMQDCGSFIRLAQQAY